MELCDTPSDFCDEHYSFDCGCEPAPAPPAPALPPAVWVVVEIYSRSVRLNETAATAPIAGKAAIFQKPEITQQVAARVVGVYAEETDARKAVPHTEGAEYIVERHDVRSAPPALPLVMSAPSQCITCGTPSATSFCKRCEQERFAMLRERDMAIIGEKVPST